MLSARERRCAGEAFLLTLRSNVGATAPQLQAKRWINGSRPSSGSLPKPPQTDFLVLFKKHVGNKVIRYNARRASSPI